LRGTKQSLYFTERIKSFILNIQLALRIASYLAMTRGDVKLTAFEINIDNSQNLFEHTNIQVNPLLDFIHINVLIGHVRPCGITRTYFK